MTQKVFNILSNYTRFAAAGLILFSIIWGTHTLRGQNTRGATPWRVGIAGGIQFTNISNPGYPSPPKSVAAPVGGVVAVYKPANWPFGIKSGLYFDSRGYQNAYRSGYLRMTDTGYIGYNSFYEYRFKSTLNYLTLPFHLVFERNSKKLKATIEAGVYYSLLLTNRVKGFNNYYIHPQDLPHFADSTLTSGNHREEVDKPIENFFNTYDFGFNISVGLGYEIKEGISAFIEPGFSYGFANVFENPDYQSKWDNIFHLHVGILYKLHAAKPKHFEQ